MATGMLRPVHYRPRGESMRLRALLILFLLLSTPLLAAACGGPSSEEFDKSQARQEEQHEAVEGEGGSEEEADENAADEGQAEESEPGGSDEGEGAATDQETEAGGGEAGGRALNADNRKLFVDTCGICHTLSDAKTDAAVGPNLDESDFDEQEVREQIEKGGSGMPADLLEGEDADAVAAYVAAASKN